MSKIKNLQLATASATPTANTIPIADGDGKLAVGWMPVGQTFCILTTPLTSTDWDGDSFSTTAKTLIDLSAVFGVPAGVTMVMVNVAASDSASQTSDTMIRLSPNDTASSGAAFWPPYVNNRFGRFTNIVPCDANGDIYYQIAASGVGTFKVHLQIAGYWL